MPHFPPEVNNYSWKYSECLSGTHSYMMREACHVQKILASMEARFCTGDMVPDVVLGEVNLEQCTVFAALWGNLKNMEIKKMLKISSLTTVMVKAQNNYFCCGTSAKEDLIREEVFPQRMNNCTENDLALQLNWFLDFFFTWIKNTASALWQFLLFMNLHQNYSKF